MSSSSPLPDGILTLALPAPNAPRPAPSASASASSRRIPPPCWSHEETLALISSYKLKWDSLRRGVLRAPDWDDVAASLARRCRPLPPNPPKTPVQCRHKIEKLRKRYRAEHQRAFRSHPNAPPRSTWLYFSKMDEIGLALGVAPKPPPLPAPPRTSSSDASASPSASASPPVPIRFRIPLGPRFGNGRPKRRPAAPADDAPSPAAVRGLVTAVRRLADGYMRMEHMNIDMMREIEKMRMDMELKQTEMMLETQRRIVDAFATSIGGRNKARVSPDC